MALSSAKLDRIYQNKPKLLRVNNLPIHGNAYQVPMNNYMSPQQTQQMGYPQSYPNNYGYPPPQFPGNNLYQQGFNQNPGFGPPSLQMIANAKSMKTAEEGEGKMLFTLPKPTRNTADSQEQLEEHSQHPQEQFISGRRQDFNKMPPPPPPPPEMIQALMGLTMQMQMGTQNFNESPPPFSFNHPPPPQQMPNVLPQSLLKSNYKLKLTSHVYKNQNASSAPLNPKFYKMNNQQQKVEKEKLYKPNTGYVIEEEEFGHKENAQAKELNIVMRGNTELIQSGITTEHDGEEKDEFGSNISAEDKQYINQKFLVSDSISESQFKEQMPKLYVDPKHACMIEEQKILEKEKEEEEFQKKKEVFLFKNKYKILAEMEKDKSKKLMEKLLQKDLDEIEKRTKEQERSVKLEGEIISKQKEQARDLEKIVKDIREERDYKTIKKVLGINIEKPIDEIIDMEKIKADYVLEDMYRRNEQLFQETNKMLQECNYFVDENGKSQNVYNRKQMNVDMDNSIVNYYKKQIGYDSEEEISPSNNKNNSLGRQTSVNNSSLKNNSQYLATSYMADSKLLESQRLPEKYDSKEEQKHAKVRFSTKDNTNPPPSEQQIQQAKFYENISKRVQEAQNKLNKLCDSQNSEGLEELQREEEKQSQTHFSRRPKKSVQNEIQATRGNSSSKRSASKSAIKKN